jgi:hypothetical protein
VGGRNKDKKTNLAHAYTAQTVINVHARQLVFLKKTLFNLMGNVIGQIHLSGIFNGRHLIAIDLIGPYLAQKYLVGPYGHFGLMGSYRSGNLVGINRTFYENRFYGLAHGVF